MERKTKLKKGCEIGIVKFIFGTALFLTLLFLILGEFVLPMENPTGNEDSVLFEAQWERVREDGTREKVDVPGRYEVAAGEVLCVEAQLPAEQTDTWFCMRASQRDVRIYVGDELRQEYISAKNRILGRNSASAYVFFRVNEEDAGKVLRMELSSPIDYVGILNAVYTGDRYDMVRLFLGECAGVLLVSFCMLILSSLTVMVGCIAKVIYKKGIDIVYLGLGVLLISLIMLAESEVRQFFVRNISVVSQVGMLLTILVPYPFLVYVNRLQKRRYEKAYRLVGVGVILNLLLSAGLQLLQIKDLIEVSSLSYGVIVTTVFLVTVTIILDIRQGRGREYGEIIFGLAVMIVIVLWEVYVVMGLHSLYVGGMASSFGLIVLLFMAVIKTVREMLAIENEKQAALLAGEAKTQFLANMSHEIRTPIHTILGMNEMVLREEQDESVREYARKVESAGKLLLALVNDILDFSKMEAGRLSLHEADYALAGMLGDVIEENRLKTRSKGLSFEVKIQENLPSRLLGDEIRIRQILNNLLSNAVKYTKEGSITFAVRGEEKQGGFFLQFMVEDTGAGIKEEDMEHLFESFKRLEEKKNRHIEGTGLGLNITRQLTDMMGGEIEVESRYHEGSCFLVTLPQKIMDRTPIGNMKEAEKERTAGEKEETYLYAPDAVILVVDDNEMNLMVAQSLLKRTKIQVFLARNGEECLARCREQRYDLILLDQMMPDMDGVETLQLLRTEKESINQNTPAVIFTANVVAGAEKSYREAGFLECLGKPIMAQELEEMLMRCLPKEKTRLRKPEVSLKSAQLEIREPEKLQAEETGLFHIDRETALKYCSNNEKIYKEVVEVYCTEGKEYLEKFSKYYKESDWKQYKVIAHALKGTSRLIGATVFAEKVYGMEQAAKQEDAEFLQREHLQFVEELEELLRRLTDENKETAEKD